VSIAIVNTQNTMGVRTLSGYQLRPVWRGPAEPGPRAANHPVQGLQGWQHNMGTLGAPAMPRGEGAKSFGPAIFHPVTPPPVPAPAGSSAAPSQAPTGSVVSSYTELTAAIAPSTATQIAPAPNPTAIAVAPPASTPGYVVVQSGGGTSSEDYISEIEAWLSSNSLLATISPSLNIPNWIPALGVGLVFALILSGKKR
jgi:hypothetical protein